MPDEQLLTEAQDMLAETTLGECERSTHFGEAVIICFQRLMKGASFYSPNNMIFTKLVRECLREIHAITRDAGSLILRIVQDACLANEVRVRMTAHTFSSFQQFVSDMTSHDIGEISFKHEVTGEELTELVYLLLALEEHNEGNYILLIEQLEERGIHTISVDKLKNGVLREEESARLKRKSKEVYFSTIGVIKELTECTKERQVLHIRKAKRLMLNAVDIIMQDESALLGLANIKSYDDYTFTHCVNVAFYAIALGQRIGLPKKYINYLGISGLFHDIGKITIDKDILNKPGPLTPKEWESVKQHPVYGAEIALRLKGWGDLSAKIMEAAFEHHLKYDASGYPQITQPRKPSLFSRIIAIADCYDALSRPRVYRRVTYISEKILGLMLQQSGKDFDPVLVKVFINMVGVFPLGALVQLDTDEIGIVSVIHGDASLIAQPIVTLMVPENGEYQKGEEVDLTEIDEATGHRKRTIVATLDPNDYGINIEEFYL